MSDFAKLLIGLALLLSSFGAVMVLRPHRGKDATRLVKMPFAAPLLASLITIGVGVGILLVFGYFTTFNI
jgi:hypothetical protein